jgi:endonuclease/exonuclease/phosphatase family metal-dependent hydrolase
MIQVGRNGSPTSLLCCNAHTETLNHLYGFSIVKCSNLLVASDFNDDYNSAPLREVSGKRGGAMTDLRPADSSGDVWTCFQASTDSFSRFDYMFVSEGMLPEVVRKQTRVIRDPLTYEASDHRPVVAVFLAGDQ